MNVLLTGGSGFIGSHVLQELVNREIPVTCLYNKAIPKIDSKLVTFHQFDLLNASDLDYDKMLKEVQPSHCLHTAWYTNHSDYLTHEINKTWRNASIQLIQSFYSNGGNRFVGTGTCIEYDTSISGFYNEDKTPLKPNTLYAQCKIDVNNSLQQIASNSNKTAAWARIFFVYGPNDRDNRLIPYIIDQLNKNNIAEPRFGALKRDYNYVKDLAYQLCDILTSDINGSINTGSGKAFKLQDFFNIVGEAMHKKDLISENLILAKDQPEIIGADISKYLKEVNPNFIPTPLEDGLNATIQAHK